MPKHPNRRRSVSEIGRLAVLVVAMPILASCYVRASLPIPTEVSSSCPDLSGDFFFPGVGNEPQVCSVLSGTRNQFLRWPNQGGGFGERKAAAIVALRQRKCASLEMRLRAPEIVPGAYTGKLNLVRTRRRQTIEWTEDSLTWGDRIKPKPSFTLAPVNAARIGVYLRREPSGAMVYRATYWEALGGAREVWTECKLPVAKAEDWLAVGFEGPVAAQAGARRATDTTHPANRAPTPRSTSPTR